MDDLFTGEHFFRRKGAGSSIEGETARDAREHVEGDNGRQSNAVEQAHEEVRDLGESWPSDKGR